MFLTETLHFPSLSSFRSAVKQSPAKNLDLLCRQFDENLLRRLKSLTQSSNPPSISLSWLSLAVDLLSSTHAEAETLIADLKLSGSQDLFSPYLDDSVRLLDVCNSITSEIERLREGRLLINFVLHLLRSCRDENDPRLPGPEKLRQAKNSLSDWGNFTNRNLRNSKILIQDLAVRAGNAPRGKISNAEKLVRRTIYGVAAMTVFVAGAVVAVLAGSPEFISIRVPAEFLWAEEFNSFNSAVSGEIKRRFAGDKRRFFEEFADVEARVRSVCEVIDDVEKQNGGVVGAGGNKVRLESAVKELETVTEAFFQGLDRLFDGVDGLFHVVLRIRSGMLEKFRLVGLENQYKKTQDDKKEIRL